VRVVIHASRGDGSLEAFAAGVQATEGKVVWLRPAHWTRQDFDPKATAVLVHGLHGKAGEIHRAYRAAGVPVWITDLPRLREEDLGIGLYLNDLQWLPREVVREPVTLPPIADRAPEYVLVCGQTPGDKSHGMDAPTLYATVRRMVQDARKYALPVVYRHHPKDRNVAPADAFGADALSITTDLQQELRRAAVVVSYNSTTGWEAIAAGIPVECHDMACAYRGYQGTLTPKRRADALGRAASSQWTMYELAKPEIIRQLFAQHDAPSVEHTADTLSAAYEPAVVVADAPKRPRRARKAA
jgi:hypothetical protein